MTDVRLPRVVFAAPGSGQGKTMVTTGVMAALRSRGLVVSPHKVGPDYIDPGYHALACGRPGRNLDPHLQGEHRVAPLLAHGARTPDVADVAVIEGVMGLFDGAVGTGGFASSAHVAELVQAPVVLVVDCAATARSVGAIVHGFSRFSDRIRVTGVILNNVASTRHEAEARDGVAETGVPVLGVIPRLPDVVVPSRHLGLVPAAERSAGGAAAAVRGARPGWSTAQRRPRRRPRGWPAAPPTWPVTPWDPAAELGSRVAPRRRPRGRPSPAAPAFTFGYAETAELLAAAGAEVVTVRPRCATPAAARTVAAALVVGGGSPEVHAAGAEPPTPGCGRSVARARRPTAAPIAAECAGLLYLGPESSTAQPMCGVLPVTAAMGPRLTLGYRTAVALTDSVLSRTGERVTGHEFHRTVTTVADGTAAWGWRDDAGRPTTEGLVRRRIHASYLHVHWAGHPHLAARFVSSAAEVGR